MKNKCLMCGGDTVAIMNKSLCDACYPKAISAIYEKQCILLNAAQDTACAIIGALADKYPAMRFTPTERRVCYNGLCEFGLKAAWLYEGKDIVKESFLVSVRLHTDERGVWRELRLSSKEGLLISYLGSVMGFADLATMTGCDKDIAEWVASYYDWSHRDKIMAALSFCRTGGEKS